MAFWRAARLNLLPTTTSPKSAFTLADWRYEPIASTELSAGQPYCGGFILSVRLHRNENRWHLRRSLMTWRQRSRRLVVIASAGDMFQPEAWVRCLVVNTDSLNLPKHVLARQPRGIAKSYRRDDLLEARRPLMERRAHHVALQ